MRSLPAAIVLSLLITTLGGRPAAAHCGDECTAPLPYEIWPTSTLLAADGVLAFVVPYGRAAGALEFVTVTVRDDTDAVVAGALELNADFSVLLWRPAAPWIAGGKYTLVTHLDTAAWATKEYGAQPGACITYDREWELVIDAQALPAPVAPPVIVETAYAVSQDDSLEALVCCDGAMPALRSGPGSCYSLRLEYSGGSCARLREVGSLAVQHTLDLAGLPAVAAGNFATRLVRASDFPQFSASAELFAPECLRLEILDLARGEVFVDERCHGDDIADQLGYLEIDPSAALAESCEGQAYVCEVANYSWDESRCKTWPEGEDFEVEPPEEPAPPMEPMDPGATEEAAGCGCASGGAAPAMSLLALVLLALPRRRGAGRRRS